MEILSRIDFPFLHFVNFKLLNPFFDAIMPIITRLGDGGLIWLVTIGIMLISKKYRKIGVVSLISLGFCFFTGNYLIKPLVGRIRPCNIIDLPFEMLVPCLHDFSFPSMHTATAFSCAVVFLYADRKIGVISIILALIIAFSRIYLNLHFLTDVLFGMLYGTVIAVISVKFYRKIEKRRMEKT